MDISENIRGERIILNEHIMSKNIADFDAISDRIFLIQINSSPIVTSIIQLYAPTADASDNAIQIFC